VESLQVPSLEQLRREVWEANLGIFRAGLVTMHSGNASGIDRRRGLVIIKPSGMDYEKLRPADLAVTDLEGRRVQGRWKPSVDLPHHLYIYERRPAIGGIIHTHSNYATSFAALGRSIPAYLTAIADEFGDEIPCAPYVDNAGDHVGEAVVKCLGQAPAVLLAQHGACGLQGSRNVGGRGEDLPPGSASGEAAGVAAKRGAQMVRALSHDLRAAQKAMIVRLSGG